MKRIVLHLTIICLVVVLLSSCWRKQPEVTSTETYIVRNNTDYDLTTSVNVLWGGMDTEVDMELHTLSGEADSATVCFVLTDYKIGFECEDCVPFFPWIKDIRTYYTQVVPGDRCKLVTKIRNNTLGEIYCDTIEVFAPTDMSFGYKYVDCYYWYTVYTNNDTVNEDYEFNSVYDFELVIDSAMIVCLQKNNFSE